MKAVVTGGAGFIGSNLVEELANRGNEVVILDDLATGKMENITDLLKRAKVKFIRGSVTDLELLTGIFNDVDYVFHQAAIPSVQRSVEDPLVTNEVNVQGTLNVLFAAKECGVEKVVYASTAAVYGDTPELPKREDMKPNPKSPYAVSKLTGEQYCAVFGEVYGLKTVCLRYFNVYGPKQDPASEYAAVIPLFITRVLANKPPIIYGDGEQTRDFAFVKDVVHANILASERGEGVFNIASGMRISLNELSHTIIGMIDKDLKPVYTEPRKGDIKHSLADVSLAKEKLGYDPEYGLEKGLKETIEYFKDEITMRFLENG
ncbi:MAG TPA: SDR family oxidoreductase [Candidatus Bathyarchaeia archaeon]|nr:SDR family oxidoreductase [Candidatus Bathyarchaeia archaeon]